MYVLYAIVKFHINRWWTIPKIWLPNYVLYYVGLSSKKYGWKTVLLPLICYLLLAVNVWGSSALGMLDSWWLVTLQSAVNNPSPPFKIAIPPPSLTTPATPTKVSVVCNYCQNNNNMFRWHHYWIRLHCTCWGRC